MMKMTDFSLVFAEISAEFSRAEALYPVWPGIGHRGDHVWAAAILAEEAGEVLKDALNWQAHERGSLADMRGEAIQTAAMAIRLLLNLDAVERQRINESARQELSDEHNTEPEHGDSINWHYLKLERITYPQQAERLVVEDYSEEAGV